MATCISPDSFSYAYFGTKWFRLEVIKPGLTQRRGETQNTNLLSNVCLLCGAAVSKKRTEAAPLRSPSLYCVRITVSRTTKSSTCSLSVHRDSRDRDHDPRVRHRGRQDRA